MNLSILLGAIAALLLLALLKVAASARSRLLVPALVAGGVVAVVAIGMASDVAGYHPNSRALRLARHVETALVSAAGDPAVERVILVEGSSYTARGLDGAMLERLLTNGTGSRTRVIQMSLDGANHFERTWLLGIALGRLSAHDREALRGKHLTLLLEIQRGYDLAPMNGFVRNLRTWRTYAYMTPANAVDGLRAVDSLGGLAPERVTELLAPSLEHAAVNALGIGMARRGTRMAALAPVPGYQPLRRSKRGYSHGDGMAEVVARARQMLEVRPVATVDPRWVRDIRVPAYTAMLGDLLDGTAFFAIPSTEVEDLEHVGAFCARVRDVPCLEYRDPALLKRLMRRADWNDARHMRVGGAEKFTRWFARRYVRDVIGEQGK
ncbi:hypothetical protein GCM10028862_18390 [Luteimonas pelagia]